MCSMAKGDYDTIVGQVNKDLRVEERKEREEGIYI